MKNKANARAPKLRIVRPEEEDRRTGQDSAAKESGVESMPDGEAAAEREVAKARDD